MYKGFGTKPATNSNTKTFKRTLTGAKFNKSVEQAVNCCRNRHSELLNQIVDNVNLDCVQDLYMRVVELLENDIESICWFCGYFAGEDEDSTMIDISRMLINHGMQAFEDFVPMFKRRIVIVNKNKFKELPLTIQETVDNLNKTAPKLVRVK